MISPDFYAGFTSSGHAKYEVVNELLRPFCSFILKRKSESLLEMSYVLPSVSLESLLHDRWDLNPFVQHPHSPTAFPL
ncbi:hypothetical protein TNCV_3523831 [Trichonephila clavipes]|uniref:Uncharacterized protein n=1 Tax=Trichonephila clavipes TaxID=2585209 RepID=A0A8X6S2Z0_TRICX|nr:hypothetical protein TNCV_3523831 [Trichonephila clavipes]